MRTSTPIVSSLVAAALVLAPVQIAFAAPEEGDSTEEAAEEESPEGEEAEEAAEGEEPEGEAAEGEEPEGEEAVEGEEAEGEEAEGEEPEGEAAEGEETEGEAAEGEEAEGEEAEGEGAEGEEAEGEAAEGESSTPSFLDQDDDGRPPEPRIANKPAKGKGLMIAGGTVAGVGLAMTITFGLMTRNCSFDGPLQCRLQNQDDFLIPLGAAGLLTGAMVLGVGVAYHLRYKKWERWSPEDDKKAALIPTPTAFRGGAGLSWAGRF